MSTYTYGAHFIVSQRDSFQGNLITNDVESLDFVSTL